MDKNVDNTEVSKFAEIAQEWWQVDGPQALLHLINPTRLNFIIRNTLQLNKLNVLDVGCGAGILSESLARLGCTVSALDASSELIAVAQEHAQAHNLKIDYQNILLEDFNQQQQQFDVVTCLELIEHVPSPENLIKNLAQALKPGGKLFISTINRSLAAYLGAIIFAEHLAKLLAKGTHNYAKFTQPAELNKFCEQHGLLLEKMQGIRYNPILKQASLTERCNINYICLITKPQ